MQLRHYAFLQEITHDRSLVGTLVQAGELTAEDTRVHRWKNEILHAIGIPGGVLPELNSKILNHGDCVPSVLGRHRPRYLRNFGLGGLNAAASDAACRSSERRGRARQYYSRTL
jgi:hypothetical protein